MKLQHPHNHLRKGDRRPSGHALRLAFAVMAGVLGLVLDGGRIYYEAQPRADGG
ncbi:MAG: hypothetical protein R2724_08505 [Bryobacterales bacterium]